MSQSRSGDACCVSSGLLDLGFLKTLDSGDVELRNPETSGPGTQQLWCPVLLGAFPFWKISIFLLLVNNIFCL